MGQDGDPSQEDENLQCKFIIPRSGYKSRGADLEISLTDFGNLAMRVLAS